MYVANNISARMHLTTRAPTHSYVCVCVCVFNIHTFANKIVVCIEVSRSSGMASLINNTLNNMPRKHEQQNKHVS